MRRTASSCRPSWCASGSETRKTVVYITHSIEEALLLGDRCVVMTAQPGRIKQIIDVPFPHPRNLITLSAAAEFGAAQARHLARAGGRGHARAGGDGAMSGCRPSRATALLYLISPIGLLLAVAAPADGGLRRPALRPGAERHRGAVLAACRERRAATHTGVTLLRAVRRLRDRRRSRRSRCGLLMAMFRPVRIFFDPLIAALFPIPKIALMPLLLLALRLRRRLEDRAGGDRGVLPGDREHLRGRLQHRQDLLGRGEELRRQPDGDVHPRRVLRRAADDLRRPAHRARGLVHRAGRGRVRRHQGPASAT